MFSAPKLTKYIVIVAYEEEKQVNIKQVLKDAKQNNSKEIALIIGPEGGIAKEEIEFLNTISSSYHKKISNLKTKN